MRKFKCAPFGDFEVDLDDPATYKHLPNKIRMLEDRMYKNIGYALTYMNYIYPNWDKKQAARVNNLIKNFVKGSRSVSRGKKNDILWFKEQVFLFEDETENMC